MTASGQRQKERQLDWAIALHRPDVPLELELSRAICRCLQQLGHSARVVSDGEPAGLQSSHLLLLLNLTNFPAYAAQLQRPRHDRPRVLVWQMDPLPPTYLPAEAEILGLKAAGWRRRVGLSSAAEPLPRWRKLITARRLRGRLYRFCSSFGYRRACNLIHSAELADDPLDWTQIRGTMENWLDLRQGLADGWIDHVAVSTRQRQQFLAARGIMAPFIAVGSCEELARSLPTPIPWPPGHGKCATSASTGTPGNDKPRPGPGPTPWPARVFAVIFRMSMPQSGWPNCRACPSLPPSAAASPRLTMPPSHRCRAS